jgi:CheY-like chemotaxis protein
MLLLSTTILFVEDSAGDALLTGQILAEHLRPVKLAIARDGVQALMMLADRSFEPAMIILDLSLPMLSGFDVLERNPRKEVPVVIFSASVNKADEDRAYALGAAAFVQKPMDFQAYRDVVLAMIDVWALPGKDASGAATS